MRILCPTCKWLENQTDIMCALHNNPDKKKYFCMCDGADMTKQEIARYYKMKGEEPKS